MSLPERISSSISASGCQPASVLVIGGGPVGMRAAQVVHKSGLDVTVLSAETMPPYNRVRLTPLLGGDVQFGEITLDSDHESDGFELALGQRVTRVMPDEHKVITADGAAWSYEQLIIATGSSAFVPNIKGKDLPGVYTFRTADDASALLARSFSARRVAVVGGGLLGLEAARGMRRRQCDVTVIEHERNLMPRQLDPAGGAVLAERIQHLGVDVRTGIAVREITGDDRVTGLTLSDGSSVNCDTIIICTGVRPNIDLAREAKLAFNRGIIVNDQMQTSHPDIYAVGECVEHEGQIYGLVGPGYAQADVAASVILGTPASFTSSPPTTKLKVIGAEVFSAGPIEQLIAATQTRSHSWTGDEGYRRIFIQGGKLVGAIAVGDWAQSSRIQDAIGQGATVYPWMLYRFRKHGALWPDDDPSIATMPDSSILCNCTGVTCGQIRAATEGGNLTVPDLSAATGAGTVCGSCQPLLAELLDADSGPEPMRFWKPLLGLSTVAGAIAFVPILIGYVPLPDQYDADSLREWLWRDNIVKQWSGFILLGLTLSAFLIGLRKRLRFMDRLGAFDHWRLVHLGLGLAALVGLFAHTGFNLGAGLNRWLGVAFLAVLLIGAVAGAATGGDHELRARRIGTAQKPARKPLTLLHIMTLWPLPALILMHVLASYAF